MKAFVQLTVSLFCMAALCTPAYVMGQTIPITAASFPRAVIPQNAGKITFWAKLTGFDGVISVGGIEPYLFLINTGPGKSAYGMGFNSNDGQGSGGLVGLAGPPIATGGYNNNTGTGLYGTWTFEEVLGKSQISDWHYYEFVWDMDGIPELHDSTRKVAIYIDGVLNSQRWQPQDVLPRNVGKGGTLNLITLGNPGTVNGLVAIDEFKIYNKKGELLLWNSLGSPDEINHSIIGLDGSFNGGGNAHFVPGISGYALEATPVNGIVTLKIDGSGSLSSAGNKIDLAVKVITNPVTDNVLNVSITGNIVSDLQVSIIDMQGKILYAEKVLDIAGSLNKEINIGSLPAGIYLLRAITNQSQQVATFVKAN